MVALLAFLTLLAAPLLSVTVHRPLLPLAFPGGCGFTLPLPLRYSCLLANRIFGTRSRVPRLALLSIISALGFSASVVPSLGAVTCACCYCTLYCFSCSPLSSLAVPVDHMWVSLLFVFLSCLLISHLSLAILVLAPRPFCLQSFFIVAAFPPVVPPGWSPSGFFTGAPCSLSLYPSSFGSVCPPLVPSSFLLPSYLTSYSQVVLYP